MNASATICPKCGSSMVLRQARKGKYEGSKFYGCSKFPSCREIVAFDGAAAVEIVEVQSPRLEGAAELIKEDLRASQSFYEQAFRDVNSTPSQFPLARLAEMAREKNANLREIMANPYGLRIDAIDETGRRSKWYFTKNRVSLTSVSPFLLCWTSPLAQLRHNDVGTWSLVKVPKGDVEYEVKLKGTYGRSAPHLEGVTYDTENGRFQFANSSQVTDSSDSGREAGTKESISVPVPKTRDFGLQEIIFLTDLHQDSTMRFPMNGHLLIEGAPGSGKTTIALQRIVYLIDQQYDELDIAPDQPFFLEQKMVVFVASDILVPYLEKLLRSVGVQRVPVVSIRNYIEAGVRSRAAATSVRQRSADPDPFEVYFKSRLETVDALRTFSARIISERLNGVVDSIRTNLQTMSNGGEAVSRYVADEIARLVNSMGRSLQIRRISVASIVSEITDMLFLGGSHQDGRRRDRPQKLVADVQLRNMVIKHVNEELQNLTDPAQILIDFVSSDECNKVIAELAARLGEQYRKNFFASVQEWRASLEKKQFEFNDFILLAWLSHWRTMGLPSMEDDDRTFASKWGHWVFGWATYCHIVIDEAQDLTPSQLAFLNDLVDSRFSSSTIVGDLAQRINWPYGLDTWEAAGLRVGNDECRHGVFKVNYRQTYELGQLAFNFHRVAFEREPQFEPGDKRRGPKPVFLHDIDFSKRCKLASGEIHKMFEHSPNRTIAIFLENETDQSDAAKILTHELYGTATVQLSSGHQLQQRGVVHITTTAEAKGLEFDCAVVLEGNRTEEPSERKNKSNRLYVALTRACDELAVIAESKDRIWTELSDYVQTKDESEGQRDPDDFPF